MLHCPTSSGAFLFLRATIQASDAFRQDFRRLSSAGVLPLAQAEITPELTMESFNFCEIFRGGNNFGVARWDRMRYVDECVIC